MVVSCVGTAEVRDGNMLLTWLGFNVTREDGAGVVTNVIVGAPVFCTIVAGVPVEKLVGR